MAKLGGGPEAVAKKIEKAITTARPRPRYTVTAVGEGRSSASGKLLTDRMWDRLMATQFSRPGR